MTIRHPPRKPAPASTPARTQDTVPQAASDSGSAPPAERLAYSVDEAAQITGLSRDLLYDQMRRGNLNYLKVGRRRLITRQHLEQFLGITPGPHPSSAVIMADDHKAAKGAP